MLKDIQNTLRGQSLVEYALILSGVAILVLTAVLVYGQDLAEMYNLVQTFFKDAS